MKQQTELMRHILKNDVSQRIIDFVSPIYGDSYVALWIYEAIGVALSELTALAEQLRYETNPNTTELLMDYWEDQYGLYRDSRLTMEQRRARLLDKIRYRAPCNPKRLAAAMQTVLGVPVSITERVAKNTFRVEILQATNDFQKLLRAIEVLESKKPAHLIYDVAQTSGVDETTIKLARSLTQAESYKVDVEAVKLALQTTLEKAVKLGAGLSFGEQYYIEPRSSIAESQGVLVSNIRMAAPISNKEEFTVTEIRQAARAAVEAAFSIASPGEE